VLANISVAWVIINMVPFGMALGYAYLPHNKNVVHGLLVSLSRGRSTPCAYSSAWAHDHKGRLRRPQVHVIAATTAASPIISLSLSGDCWR
jgi:hypothetical protein